ncbi:hypothetical protein JW926_11600 [Candidatus Sumerlaeota bacterium]|nr:hypothetical protein [Candidatus Sumerlaeota bacterium]
MGNEEKKQGQIKRQAIPGIVILAGIGALLFMKGKSWFFIPWVFALYLLLGLFHPPVLSPFLIAVRILMKYAAWLTTRIVLIFVYFFFIIPIGLWFRLIGRDRLNLKFPGKEDSFWKKRPPEEQIPRCDRQF